MTNPSHLKVRYLFELPELPPGEVENSWTYTYVPNGPDKDYKVFMPTLIEEAVDGVSADILQTAADYTDQEAAAALSAANLYTDGAVDDVRQDLLDDSDSHGTDMVVYRLDATNAEARSARDKLGEIVSVKDFGAVGDGVTDDLLAFRAAVDYLKSLGGGTLLIPPGTYVVNGGVFLCSNLHIEGSGAVITKTAASPYSVFVALSGTAQGYGSSVQNVTVKGLTFRGDFSNGIAICGFALHHAKNVLIEDCSFVEAVMNGHAIDACGCDGITVRNCVFEGFNPTTAGRDRTEAIQMDVSSSGSVSYNDNPASYDGLMTRNLTVDGCKFLPLTIGTTTYPCPNPVGSHAAVEGRQYEGLRFTNNLIVDPHEDIATNDGATGPEKGVIHFPALKNAVFADNEFIMRENRCVRAISLYSMTHGIPDTGDWANPSSRTTIPPVLTQNVTIRGNVFRGFSHRSGIPVQHTIFLRGLQTAPVENVTIVDNKFEDAYRNSSNHLDVLGRYANGITVSGNSFTDTGTAVKSEWGNDWRAVGNNFLRCRAQPIIVQDTDGFAMLSNTARQCGLAYRTQGAAQNIAMVGNTFVDSTNTGAAASGIALAEATTNYTVNGNTIVYQGTATQGIVAAGTTSNGVISGNIITGYSTKVNVGASATNVTAVNNY